MAYQGYLIKVGNYTIPHKFIKADTYITTYITQDLDSYRDMDGVLHRTALKHKVAKTEFETIPMTNAQKTEFMSNIQNNYIDENEKKLIASVYVPEIDDYITQEVYVPDIPFQIYGILRGIIRYQPARIAFIGY